MKTGCLTIDSEREKGADGKNINNLLYTIIFVTFVFLPPPKTEIVTYLPPFVPELFLRVPLDQRRDLPPPRLGLARLGLLWRER